MAADVAQGHRGKRLSCALSHGRHGSVCAHFCRTSLGESSATAAITPTMKQRTIAFSTVAPGQSDTMQSRNASDFSHCGGSSIAESTNIVVAPRQHGTAFLKARIGLSSPQSGPDSIGSGMTPRFDHCTPPTDRADSPVESIMLDESVPERFLAIGVLLHERFSSVPGSQSGFDLRR
jgi:hypothetical protein